jgi:adenosylcobyric acid synthase
MVQGTGSDVGKSLIVAGLCRAFVRRGLNVAPFKPQNMSNNAAVTADGGEIGRAQALQAQACRLEPSRHMNPVLLKPESDRTSQLIVQGRVQGRVGASDYQTLKPMLLPRVLASFAEIGNGRDLVLIEGAGSPAEINLRSGDIANMGFAQAADVPVVLVGDIDRGGVIAALAGTHILLPESEQLRVRGFIINKFRGDPSLFASALATVEQLTGWRAFGILPWFADAALLPAEDGVVLETKTRSVSELDGRTLRIVVPRLRRISNFDDFDPLVAEPDIHLDFVAPGRPLPLDADLIILPGSKATIADLAFLRQQGWDIDLLAHRRRGGRILGICAGYQMLGTYIDDPAGIEGPPGGSAGLGLLDVATIMQGEKTLRPARGEGLGAAVFGYEMHMGVTSGAGMELPFLQLETGADGAVSADGRVMGCTLHGLFASDAFRRRFLDDMRPGRAAGDAFGARVERILDSLAAHVETHLNLDDLLAEARV